MRINRADGKTLFPVEIPAELTEGATLFRNRDQEFERSLEKESAERRISIQPVFSETADGFALTLTDEDQISVTVDLPDSKEMAKNAERALSGLSEQLGKFGNTMFVAQPVELKLSQAFFLPTSAINALRREATEKLETARMAAHAQAATRHASRAANTLPAGRTDLPRQRLQRQGPPVLRKARCQTDRRGL